MNYELIIIAAIGGLAIQLLNLLELGNIKKEDRPDFKDFVYYIPYILNPLFAVLVTYVYLKSNTQLNPILALHLGASAPVILRSLAASIPNKL
jgi:hypothetical protein